MTGATFSVVLAIAVNVTIIVAALAGLARWARRWARTQVAAIQRELNPPTEGSTHEYAKAAANMSATTVQRFDELAGGQREIRKIALEAYAKASDAERAAVAAHRRVDDHLRRKDPDAHHR